MMQSLDDPGRMRSKFRRRFDRLRNRSQGVFQDSAIKGSPRPSQISKVHSELPASLSSNVSSRLNTRIDDIQIEHRQESPVKECTERSLTSDESMINRTSIAITSSDLWSAAYREAVKSFQDEIDIIILEGKNVAQLFAELDQLKREGMQESAFKRGLQCLHSLQVPLERFKLLLDLASPLASIEPTATTVIGLLKGMTAFAISFATADLDFAKQITEMLEKISYINNYDTLGRKSDRKDIHKILVMVYQKMLEFYKVTYEMLRQKGAKLLIKMVLETDHLLSIVSEFLQYSDTLRNLIQKATWEIMEDIKSMLYNYKIARWLGSDQISHQYQYHDELQTVRADQAYKYLLRTPSFVN